MSVLQEVRSFLRKRERYKYKNARAIANRPAGAKPVSVIAKGMLNVVSGQNPVFFFQANLSIHEGAQGS